MVSIFRALTESVSSPRAAFPRQLLCAFRIEVRSSSVSSRLVDRFSRWFRGIGECLVRILTSGMCFEVFSVGLAKTAVAAVANNMSFIFEVSNMNESTNLSESCV